MSPKSQIQGILLKAGEFDVVQLKFNFNKYEYTESTYTFDLIQKDEDGNTIGGETFIVEPPLLIKSEKPVIISKPIDDEQVQLKVDKSGFNSIKWVDGKGETLGNDEVVNVSPIRSGNDYTVIAMTDDGNVATGSISLENEYGIKSVSASANCITGSLKGYAPKNAVVSVNSLVDGSSKTSDNVEEGTSKFILENLNLSRGVYVVSYTVNSVLMDQLKVNIE